MITSDSVLSFLVALLSFTVTVTVSLSDNAPIGSRIAACKFQFRENGSIIDLNPLASHDSTNWKFTNSSAKFHYLFSPCWPMTQLSADAKDCNGAVACQQNIKDSSLYYDLGNPSTEVFSVIDSSVVVSYSAVTGGTNRTIEITLACDESLQQFSLTNEGETTYQFTLRAKECCASSKAISFGTVLCIIFLVFVFVYFIGGILINKFARGATGAELIPNRSFWADLPNLIKEGFQFTGAKIHSCFSRDSQYDQI